VPEPEPDEGEVVIQVDSCGICGTDLSLHQGSLAVLRETRIAFPIIIGHEFTGEVIGCGNGVDSPSVGDWVVVNPHLYCGECFFCLRGEQEICDRRPMLAWERPGGAAEFVAVRARNAYTIDAQVARRVGVLAEPMAVAIHAVRRFGASREDRVVIVGPGPIGLLVAIACSEAGLEPIVVGLEVDRKRLRVAAQLGFQALTGDEASIRDEIMGATDGMGADVVFEAAGSEHALELSLTLVRRSGRVGALGIPHHPVSMEMGHIVLAEKTISGLRGYAPQDWERTVQVLTARSAELTPLVTHRLPLEGAEAAMQLLESRNGMKVALAP
jgi:2-desacetyl-2-hydroxyethyl bacteriochlorophyllide A dehydrogenase